MMKLSVITTRPKYAPFKSYIESLSEEELVHFAKKEARLITANLESNFLKLFKMKQEKALSQYYNSNLFLRLIRFMLFWDVWEDLIFGYQQNPFNIVSMTFAKINRLATDSYEYGMVSLSLAKHLHEAFLRIKEQKDYHKKDWPLAVLNDLEEVIDFICKKLDIFIKDPKRESFSMHYTERYALSCSSLKYLN